MPNRGYRLGIDVGGTFTDLVAASPTGEVRSLKVPTTPANQSEAILVGVQKMVAELVEVEAIVHGTTVVTNAILEGRGAVTALVTTRGFRDVLEIGRQDRLHLYQILDQSRPTPLVPRHLRLEATERVLHDGTVTEPLRLEELPALAAELRAAGAESVAICFLHSYANPEHEMAARAELARHFRYVSVSSEVNAEFREFERASTTVLNAFVMPLAAVYLNQLQHELAERGVQSPLRLIQSNGGMMSCEVAARRPLSMIMSGPAAGVAATRYLLARCGEPNAITFDMGGTSTDVCLISQGEVEVAAERKIDGRPIRMPSVAVESIGAGGGSIAWLDAAGALKVGPRSAGSFPGPASYGRGGEEPTVTDANVVLGFIAHESVLSDTIRIDRGLAERALSSLGKRLGLSVEEMAAGIIEIANASMIRALRLVSVQRGYDPREFALVAYGGAGPIHAGRLAQLMKIPRVIVPAFSSVFSAFGCLVSDVRYDAVCSFRARLAKLNPAMLAARFATLEEPVRAQLLREGYPAEAIRFVRSLDLRYLGQNYEIEIPLPDGSLDPTAIRQLFDARHQQLYAYSTAEEVEVINLRTAGIVPASLETTPGVPPAQGSVEPIRWHPVTYPEVGPIKTPSYSREALGEGAQIAGPAIVEDAWSTVVVYPGQSLQVDRWGNLIIEVGR